MGAQDRRCNPLSNPEALVNADLDTLATELYVRTDDLLKTAPERTPWRPVSGISPKITDAELVTLETRKQTEPMASGRHTCWWAACADRSVTMATRC